MSITDLYNYKDAYKINKLINNVDHPNIILYGNNDINKSLFIKVILNSFFRINNNEMKIMNEDIYYEYNDYYYYFNVNKIKHDLKNSFINIIKNITNTYNYYTKKFNYIILDNFENINSIIENKLKVIFEKTSNTTKFIILTSGIHKINEAIKSRFICIRLPLMNIIDKEIFLKKYIDKNNIKIEKVKLDKLIQNYNDIDFTIKILDNDFKDPIDIFFNKIIISLNKKLNKNLNELKEICYNIKNSLIDINILFKRLLNHYISLNINHEKKYKIIKEISNINYLMINCYKDIIYLEYFFLTLYKIIHE